MKFALSKNTFSYLSIFVLALFFIFLGQMRVLQKLKSLNISPSAAANMGATRELSASEELRAVYFEQVKKKIQNNSSYASVFENLKSVASHDGLEFNFVTADLFESGRATTRPDAEAKLKLFVHELANLTKQNKIEIEAHTDNSRIVKNKHLYPTNWELSSARAAIFARLFEGAGFKSNQIRVVGRGSAEPISQDPRLNKRIVIRIK